MISGMACFGLLVVFHGEIAVLFSSGVEAGLDAAHIYLDILRSHTRRFVSRIDLMISLDAQVLVQ